MKTGTLVVNVSNGRSRGWIGVASEVSDKTLSLTVLSPLLMRGEILDQQPIERWIEMSDDAIGLTNGQEAQLLPLTELMWTKRQSVV